MTTSLGILFNWTDISQVSLTIGPTKEEKRVEGYEH